MRREDRLMTVLVAIEPATDGEALAAALARSPGLQVVGAGSPGQAANLAARLQPEVVVLQSAEAGSRLLAMITRLGALPMPPRVVALLAPAATHLARGALLAGADAVCLAERPARELAEALRAVVEGHVWLDGAIARAAAGVPAPVGGGPFSEREREVLVLLAAGLRNDEIAEALAIAVSTVKTHVRHILRRLGASDRAQAVIAAMARGYLPALGPAPAHERAAEGAPS